MLLIMGESTYGVLAVLPVENIICIMITQLKSNRLIIGIIKHVALVAGCWIRGKFDDLIPDVVISGCKIQH